MSNLVGLFSQSLGVGVVLAVFNPTPSSWTYVSSWSSLGTYLVPLVLFQVFANNLWDTHFFFSHRYFHLNKTLYRFTHKFHHMPDASLDSFTTGFMDPVDSIVTVGLVLAAVSYISCFLLHSYWAYAVAIHTMLIIQIGGHTGTNSPRDDLGGWLWVLLSPTMVSLACLSNAAKPSHHFQHHWNPLCNFGLASTFWDDLYGTVKPAQLPHPFSLMMLDLAFMATLLLWAQWFTQPLQVLPWLAVWLLPNAVQRLIVAPFSSWVPRLSLWDKVRDAYQVTYAPKGSPGSFEADPQQRYIFCYHPQNIIARGAWYTFAGELAACEGHNGSSVAEWAAVFVPDTQ
jgi:sterol desaturase/sphingolipid hydroxylase (fatty acid hydroxylase superfamily)